MTTTPEHSAEPVTHEAVQAKMKQMEIAGLSFIGTIAPEIQMSCLNEIERLMNVRYEPAENAA